MLELFDISHGAQLAWVWPLVMALGSAVMQGQKEAEQRKQRAAEVRYSPWTGTGVTTQISSPGYFGGALQGFTSGMGMQQGMESAAAGKETQGLYNDRLKAETNYYNKLGGAPTQQSSGWAAPGNQVDYSNTRGYGPFADSGLYGLYLNRRS